MERLDKKPGLVCKFDFELAYVESYGFWGKMVKMDKSLCTLYSVSILINGPSNGFF